MEVKFAIDGASPESVQDSFPESGDLFPGVVSPVVFDDIPSFSVDTILNDAALGAGASSTPVPTTTPEPDDEGWAWYYYLLIGIGGALVLAAIAGLIWYTVDKNKKTAEYARLHPEPPPATAGRKRGTAAAYPPPHPSSKVIQIPLVHHHVHPSFAETLV